MSWYKRYLKSSYAPPADDALLMEVAEKIIDGNKVWTSQELQVQQNYPDLLEEYLVRAKFLSKYPKEITVPELSNFVLSRSNKAAQMRLVNIDVNKFDGLFQNDEGFYIGRGGIGHTIHDRYPRFGDFLRTGQPIEASTVFITEDGNKAGFSNGRHRYSFLRDMGMEVMPVAMDPNTLKIAKRLGLLA